MERMWPSLCLDIVLLTSGLPHKTYMVCAGAMAAVAVGAGCMCPSLRLGMTLLAFFGSSSRLTSFKEELKDVDDQHRQGGQRDWQQVRTCLS